MFRNCSAIGTVSRTEVYTPLMNREGRDLLESSIRNGTESEVCPLNMLKSVVVVAPHGLPDLTGTISMNIKKKLLLRTTFHYCCAANQTIKGVSIPD
jgi:hypothetical protein